MKKKTCIIASFFVITSLFAQSKTDCKEKYETLETYYKTIFPKKKILTQDDKNKIRRLTEPLLTDCPAYQKEIYLYAEEIFLKIIKPMNLGAERQQWTQHLSVLYDKYSENFPDTRQENFQKKIVLSYENNLYDSSEEALKTFDELFLKQKQYFAVRTLLIYADLLVQQGRREYEISIYIKKINELSQNISDKISELKQKRETVTDQIDLKKINTNIESLKIASKNISFDKIVLNCEELNAILKNDFEKNKTDIKWLEQILTSITQRGCIDNDVFEELVHTYYELEKNSKSAFYMGFLEVQKKNYEEAISYLNQAAQTETDKIEKANIYYKISNIYSKNEKAKRKEYLEKTLENNSKMITASLSLAQLYIDAEKDCFESDFAYQTRYYLAIQLLNKFIKNNPNYQKTLQNTINEYIEEAPTKKEIRKAKMKGKAIKVGCWINQEFTLP